MHIFTNIMLKIDPNLSYGHIIMLWHMSFEWWPRNVHIQSYLCKGPPPNRHPLTTQKGSHPNRHTLMTQKDHLQTDTPWWHKRVLFYPITIFFCKFQCVTTDQFGNPNCGLIHRINCIGRSFMCSCLLWFYIHLKVIFLTYFVK